MVRAGIRLRHTMVAALALALALTGCTDRGTTTVVPGAAQPGQVQTVYVATTRQTNDSGWFGPGRSASTSYAQLHVAVPKQRQIGQLRAGFARVNPKRQFAITARNTLKHRQQFLASLAADLAKLPTQQRDITLYIHGYNNSCLEGTYRTAQLAHDFALPGLAVHYAWPSAASPLGYTYDRDSVLFARDGLEQLLRDLRKTGAQRVVVVAHSMGAMLTIETLRQIEIANSGWSKRHLDGVILIAPGLDIEVFQSQMARFNSLPAPFAIFVSSRDRALQLSARINGSAVRLGSLEAVEKLGQYPVTIIDVSAFSSLSDGGHFTVGSSPVLIELLGRSQELNRTFETDRAGRAGLLPGTVITVQKATQLILSPHLASTAN